MKKLLVGLSLLTTACFSNADVISFDDFSDLTAWQLNGDTAVHSPNSDNRLRLTESVSFDSGSAFLSNAITLNSESSFQAFFEFEISNPAGLSDVDGIGADGLAFVVQTNDSTVGSAGGGIGYQGIENSVAIEFDTWNNGTPDQNNGNHVGISLNGDIASTVLAVESSRFNDGGIWSVWVDYDGNNDLLEVRWADDGVRVNNALLSLTVDLTSVLNSSDAFFGFTSATGAAYGTHDIISARFVDDFEPVVEANAPAMWFMSLFALAGLFSVRRSSAK